MRPTKWDSDKYVGVIARKTVRRLEKIPSREGKEGFSLQGWVLPVWNNPRLHPSRRGESSSLLVVPIFMLCGADHAGMDGSSLIKMDLSKTLGEN